MNQLIEFALDSNRQTTVLVETTDPTPQGKTRVGVGGAVVEEASEAFDAAIAAIKTIAETVMKQLTTLADANEISVQFGIKLSASAGVIIAGTSAEGNYAISIKWARRL